MKKRGVLHAELSRCIAALGHKDLFMIGDAGMPIPPGVEVIDLAVTAGVPTFRQVLDAVLTEAEVEGYYLADEIRTNNEELHAYLQQKLKDVPAEYLLSTCRMMRSKRSRPRPSSRYGRESSRRTPM